MSLTIKGLKEVRANIDKYSKEVAKARVRALNRTISKGRTLASKEIRDEVRLTATYVRDRLKIVQATIALQRASVVAKKRGILLSRFPHSVRIKRGVTVRVKKGGGGKLLKGAFRAKVRAGGSTVDVIATRIPGRYKNGNAKFRTFYGPSPSQVLNNTKPKLTPILEQELRIQLEKELQYAAKRAKL